MSRGHVRVRPQAGRLGFWGAAPRSGSWNGTLTIVPSNAVEGSALTFGVTCSPAATEEITFTAATVSGGTAEVGIDFTPYGPATHTIAAGQSTLSPPITVATIAREGTQDARTVQLRLSAIEAGGIATSQGSTEALGTIIDATATPIAQGLHPRIGFLEADLPDLRDKYARSWTEGGMRETFQKMVNRYNTYWWGVECPLGTVENKGDPPSYYVDGACMAALIHWMGPIAGIDYGTHAADIAGTGYRDEAVRVLLSYATRQIAGQRFTTQGAAAPLAYDWCWPWMTPAQRETVLTHLAAVSPGGVGISELEGKGWGDGDIANKGTYELFVHLSVTNDQAVDTNGFDVAPLSARTASAVDVLKFEWWARQLMWRAETQGYDVVNDSTRLSWIAAWAGYRTCYGLSWATILTGTPFVGGIYNVPLLPDNYISTYLPSWYGGYGTLDWGDRALTEGGRGLHWNTSGGQRDGGGDGNITVGDGNAYAWGQGLADCVGILKAAGQTETAGRGWWWLTQRMYGHATAYSSYCFAVSSQFIQQGRLNVMRQVLLPDARGLTAVSPADQPRSQRWLAGFHDWSAWRSHPLDTGPTEGTIQPSGVSGTPNRDTTTVAHCHQHWRSAAYGVSGTGEIRVYRQGPLVGHSGSNNKAAHTRQFCASTLYLPDTVTYPWGTEALDGNSLANGQKRWGGVRDVSNTGWMDLRQTLPSNDPEYRFSITPGSDRDWGAVERYQDSTTVGYTDVDYLRANHTLAFPNPWQPTTFTANTVDVQRCRLWTRSVVYLKRPTDSGRDRIIVIDRVTTTSTNYEKRICWHPHGQWPPTISGTMGAEIAGTSTGPDSPYPYGNIFPFTDSGAYEWTNRHHYGDPFNGRVMIRTVYPESITVYRRGSDSQATDQDRRCYQTAFGVTYAVRNWDSMLSLPKTNIDSVYYGYGRIEVIPGTPALSDTFVHTLEVCRGDDLAAAVEPVRLTATSALRALRWGPTLLMCMEAATEDGQNTSTFPLTGTGRSLPAGSHTVTIDGAGAGTYDLLVLDAVPSQAYTLTVDGTPQALTATSQGTLRATITVGNGSSVVVS